jgi:hypothetical protein
VVFFPVKRILFTKVAHALFFEESGRKHRQRRKKERFLSSSSSFSQYEVGAKQNFQKMRRLAHRSNK